MLIEGGGRYGITDGYFLGAVLMVVAALTAIPAQIGATRPPAEVLRAD